MQPRDDESKGAVPERFAIDFSGQTLLGHFEIREKLDEGGMGTIYLAHDQSLDSPVVVKVPHARLLTERGFLERFDREVRDLVGLQHPHIVPILARGDHEGIPLFVLRYLGGGSLADRIRRAPDQSLSLVSLGGWLPDVARTLDFIHGQGVVHRDVKPGNILFDEHGHVFLSDFGIAKALESGTDTETLTAAGGAIGSPPYMAPEQWMAEDIDGRADQYALAATVYEALGGRTPFKGSTPEILIRKNTEGPPHLGERVSNLSPGAADTVMRALDRRKEARFESCAEFVSALLDPSTAARRVAPTVQTSSLPAEATARRRTLPLRTPTLVAAALAVLALVLSLALGGSKEEPDQPAETVKKAPAPPGTDPTPVPKGDASAATQPPPTADRFAEARKAFDEHRYADFNAAIYAAVQAGDKGLIPPDMIRAYNAMREQVVKRPSWATIPDGGPQMLAAARFGLEDVGSEVAVGDGVAPLRFLLIPPGLGKLGSPEDEDGRDPDELVHDVLFDRPFWMQTAEVTNAQFRAFRAQHNSGGYYEGGTGGSFDGDDQPAVRVGYDEVVAFADWLTQQSRDGLIYRLPTEAEWEYAARAGASGRYWWGEDATFAPTDANLADPAAMKAWPPTARAVLEAAEEPAFKPFPVDVDGGVLTASAASRGNGFGLKDVLGNVWEWCLDNPANAGRGEHVLRGGAFDDGPRAARLANRIRARSPNPAFGFRLVAVQANEKPVFAGPAPPDDTRWAEALEATLTARDALETDDVGAAVKAAADVLAKAVPESEVSLNALRAWVRAVVEGSRIAWTGEAIDRRLLAEHGPSSLAWRGDPDETILEHARALDRRIREAVRSERDQAATGDYELDYAEASRALPPEAALLRNALARARVRLSIDGEGTYLLTTVLGDRHLGDGGAWRISEAEANRVLLRSLTRSGARSQRIRTHAERRFGFDGPVAGTAWADAVTAALKSRALPGPAIAILSPKPGTVLDKVAVKVAGTVERVAHGAVLTMNGEVVSLEGTRFETTLTLAAGASQRISARYAGGAGVAESAAETSVSVDPQPPMIEVAQAADLAVHTRTAVRYSATRTLTVRGVVRDAGGVARVWLSLAGKETTPTLTPHAEGVAFQHDVSLPTSKAVVAIEIHAQDRAGHEAKVHRFEAAYDPLMVLRVRFKRALNAGDMEEASDLQEQIDKDYGQSVDADALRRLQAWRQPPTVTVDGMEVWYVSGSSKGVRVEGAYAMRRGGRTDLRLKFLGLRIGDEVTINEEKQSLTEGQARGELSLGVPLHGLRSPDQGIERALTARIRIVNGRRLRFEFDLLIWDATPKAAGLMDRTFRESGLRGKRLKTPYRLASHPPPGIWLTSLIGQMEMIASLTGGLGGD